MTKNNPALDALDRISCYEIIFTKGKEMSERVEVLRDFEAIRTALENAPLEVTTVDEIMHKMALMGTEARGVFLRLARDYPNGLKVVTERQ